MSGVSGVSPTNQPSDLIWARISIVVDGTVEEECNWAAPEAAPADVVSSVFERGVGKGTAAGAGREEPLGRFTSVVTEVEGEDGTASRHSVAEHEDNRFSLNNPNSRRFMW